MKKYSIFLAVIFLFFSNVYAQGSVDTAYLEIRRDTTMVSRYTLVCDTAIVSESKEVKKIAAILNLIWEEDICGAISDTLEMKVIVSNLKCSKIVRVTNIDMYDKNGNIGNLLSLGAKIQKQLKREIVLVIMYTGKPNCIY